MLTPRRLLHYCLLLTALAVLPGCGKKGPLYLPQPAPAQAPAPTPTPTPTPPTDQ